MEAVMTDFQFKAIMKLVSQSLDKCETVEDFIKAKNEIAKLGGDSTPSQKSDSEDM